MKNIRLRQSTYEGFPLLEDFKDREHELQLGQFYRINEQPNRVGQWMQDKKTNKKELWLFKVEVFKD